MVARGRGDDALGLLFLAEGHQCIARAALLETTSELELLVLQEDVAAAELAEPVRVRDRASDNTAPDPGSCDGDVLEEHGQSSGHGAARMRWASFCSQSLGLQQAMHCALVCGVLSDAQHCCGLLRSAVTPGAHVYPR